LRLLLNKRVVSGVFVAYISNGFSSAAGPEDGSGGVVHEKG
jgi:hypothetical protein